MYNDQSGISITSEIMIYTYGGDTETFKSHHFERHRGLSQTVVALLCV